MLNTSPLGLLNEAPNSPQPSSKPLLPLPASVVTTLVSSAMARMAWLNMSDMKRVPESTATPHGPLNKAFVPVPSAKPLPNSAEEPWPASVVVTPVAKAIVRTALLPSSATKTWGGQGFMG